jgi:hypothetical protein
MCAWPPGGASSRSVTREMAGLVKKHFYFYFSVSLRCGKQVTINRVRKQW